MTEKEPIKIPLSNNKDAFVSFTDQKGNSYQFNIHVEPKNVVFHRVFNEVTDKSNRCTINEKNNE